MVKPFPTRRGTVLGLGAAALTLSGALAQPSDAKIGEAKIGDARPQRIPIELVEEALALEGAIRVGSRSADAVIVEFFDYNCPFCRLSAEDLETLVATDPDLDYVLVNYAILGAASIEATRVALGYAALHGQGSYLAFHRALFAGRGVIGGARALAVAERLGADVPRLVAMADSEAVTRQMKAALGVGNRLGLVATPSYVVGPWAFQGHVPLERKRRIVESVRL